MSTVKDIQLILFVCFKFNKIKYYESCKEITNEIENVKRR